MRILILKRPAFNLDKFIFSNVTALEEEELEGFRLYPNPAGDRLFIAMDQSFSEASVSIFTADGMLVRQLENISPESGLDVSELASGLYLFRMTSPQGVMNRRFIKD